jgi:LacI family transcriptional regulator
MMAPKKQVTITTVAAQAGVSAQTVSRVINNRPDVAPETRARVQEVIDRLGYRPNVLARSLIRQRSHTMGVVAVAWEYYGPSHTLIGIEKQIRSEGYSLLLDLLHHPETENVERILNRLLSHQVDGILWAVPEIGKNRAWLENNHFDLPVPAVFLNMEPQRNAWSVQVENLTGGRMAAEHLLAQGYREIGTITGPLNWWEARQRLQGWQDALQSAGLMVKPSSWVEGNWTAVSGAEGLEKLLDQHPKMEAVFVGNDQMALGVLQMANQRGLRIPEDLAVVGFDDQPEAAFYCPPLTTIRQPLIEMGCRAVDLLERLIEAEQRGEEVGEAQAIWLSPELVVRESSVIYK